MPVCPQLDSECRHFSGHSQPVKERQRTGLAPLSLLFDNKAVVWSSLLHLLFFPTDLRPHPLTTDETTPDIRESPHDTQCTMPVLRDDSAAEAKKSEKVLLTGLYSEA